MPVSPKTVLKLFSATALVRAKSILKNSNDINQLADSAAKEINSGKKQLLNIRDEVGLLIFMLNSWVNGEYKEVPWTTLALCAGALIYFLNPLDAIPDLIPGAGFLDDATVIGFVLASIKQDIHSFKNQNPPENGKLAIMN